MDNKGKNSDKKTSFLSLDNILKLFSILTIFGGVYGLGVQKGIIEGMKVGNLNGSYDVQEILNSAVLGVLHMAAGLTKISFSQLFMHSLGRMLIISLIVGLYLWLLIKYVFPKLEKSKKIEFSFWKKGIALQASIVAVSSSAIGFLATLFVSAIPGFIILSSFFLVLPSLAGYYTGYSYIEKMKGTHECVFADNKKDYGKWIDQCTQVYIKDKFISGKVVLENKEGYYLHINNGFAFITKNGERCFYSAYELSEKVTDKEAFLFPDEVLKSFCVSNNKLKLGKSS